MVCVSFSLFHLKLTSNQTLTRGLLHSAIHPCPGALPMKVRARSDPLCNRGSLHQLLSLCNSPPLVCSEGVNPPCQPVGGRSGPYFMSLNHSLSPVPARSGAGHDRAGRWWWWWDWGWDWGWRMGECLQALVALAVPTHRCIRGGLAR